MKLIKNNFKIILIIALIICILISAIMYNNIKFKSISTSATTGSELSNKKINWGIRNAKDEKQPDVGSNNKKILEQYGGGALGNPDKKYVYLTFDEGYEAGYTNKILEVLKANNVKAAFFITGYYLNKETDLVKRMIEEGHIVGNHTVNHPSMPELSDDKLKAEIQDLHTAVYEKTGYEMKYLRPPKGEYSERTLDISKNLGYITTMWSFGYVDWDEKKQPAEEFGENKILSNIHPGEIMLLHATSATNANILDYCIKEIKNRGYEFKTLDEFER